MGGIDFDPTPVTKEQIPIEPALDPKRQAFSQPLDSKRSPQQTPSASSSSFWSSTGGIAAVLCISLALVAAAVIADLLWRRQRRFAGSQKAETRTPVASSVSEPPQTLLDPSIYTGSGTEGADTFDNSSVAANNDSWAARTQAPTLPESTDVESKLAYIHKQLDCFGSKRVINKRFISRGPQERKTGGAQNVCTLHVHCLQLFIEPSVCYCCAAPLQLMIRPSADVLETQCWL